MEKWKYILDPKVCYERYEEGAILTVDNVDNVICLGKFECMILDIVLKHNVAEAIEMLSTIYEGNEIENDIIEFCDKLFSLGIVQKQKI